MLGAVSRRYAHKIPFIVKINHNELLTYPNKFDQVMFGSVDAGLRPGRRRRGRHDLLRLRRVDPPDPGGRATAFYRAHELGMFTVLWCYLRNSAFKKDGVDYHNAADLTGQANHLGVTIEADIIKQKLPTNNGGYNALEGYGKTNKAVYETLTSDHPIDLCRWQVANSYMGRIGLINSGGESKGASDLAEAVRTAVINKRAGGIGLISGRKAFQRPMSRGRRAAQRHPGRLPRRLHHHRLTAPDPGDVGHAHVSDAISIGRRCVVARDAQAIRSVQGRNGTSRGTH